MPKHPKLSVITIFHNQRDVVESTIEALYALPYPALELVIINDGSTDDTGDIIYSLLDYYGHEETYFFDHTESYGLGRSLNDALATVTGDFLWIVDSLEDINETNLEELLDKLSESDSLCAVDSDLEGVFREENWLKLLEEKVLPLNQSFIWNWNKIPPYQQFFNPHLEDGHAAELALRLIMNEENYEIFSDVFQSSSKGTLPIDEPVRREFLFGLLRRDDITAGTKKRVFKILLNQVFQRDDEVLDTPSSNVITQSSHADIKTILDQARLHHREGNNAISLELIDKILANDPDNISAKKLKVAVLERMRRYVEAAEIKHSIPDYEWGKNESEDQQQSGEEETVLEEEEEPPVLQETTTSENGELEEQPEPQKVEVNPEDIVTSVIIPTTSDRKSLLERCLVSLSKHASPENTELIIIDNASLDDTCDYLEQLENDHFFNCKVVVNSRNVGFARSINMGMEKAVGKYICIMHNDVFLTSNTLQRMQKILDQDEEYAAIGPRTLHTLNPEQIAESSINTNASDGEVVPAEYLDSFCIMFRKDLDLQFDERYELAYFEDIDFCLQIREKGWKIGIAPDITVDHLYGITTSDLGIDTESPQYWKNIERFNEKWNIETVFPENKLDSSAVERLLTLNKILNPHFPEPHLLQLYSNWFTSELKTAILEKEWDSETLIGLVQLMMKADQRDVLRQLEDKLEHIELSEDILYELVLFYFERNIFSRCRHYIDEVKSDNLPFRFRLIQLKIAVTEKDLLTAVPLLKELLNELPSHPDLYKLSGDIHALEGNTREAQQFYEMASQIDPYRYSAADSAYSYED